jgi:hypothetical protein
MRAAADHANEIASHYDPENMITVFEAKTKIEGTAESKDGK